MEMKEVIARINELAAKNKAEGLTAEELVEGKRFDDVIVHNAEFLVDIHNPTGSGQAEEKIQYCKPYDLPYGCFVPKKIDGLFTAGRCISADRAAYASIRVQATVMALGEAAGYAAAQALDKGIEAHEVDVQQVRAKILENNGILERP